MSYSKHHIDEIHEVRNFPTCLGTRKCVEVPLQCFDGNWSIWLFQHTEDFKPMITTAISKVNFGEDFQIGIHYSILILNYEIDEEDEIRIEQKGHLSKAKFVRGKSLPLEELVDESYGYLRNGTLRIEVSITIESIMDNNLRISKFYFLERFFDYKEIRHNARLEWENNADKSLVCHRQMVTLHLKHLANRANEISMIGNIVLTLPEHTNYDIFEIFLQISHGVYHSFKDNNMNMVCHYAKSLETRNVIRFCERQIIQREIYFHAFGDPFEGAIYYKMEHLLKHLLIHVDTVAFLKSVLCRQKIQSMSSEAMKSFVAKFISLT